jgi:hypothetical protein
MRTKSPGIWKYKARQAQLALLIKMHSLYNVSHNAQTKPGTLSQTDNENEIGLEKITDIRTDQADI